MASASNMGRVPGYLGMRTILKNCSFIRGNVANGGFEKETALCAPGQI